MAEMKEGNTFPKGTTFQGKLLSQSVTNGTHYSTYLLGQEESAVMSDILGDALSTGKAVAATFASTAALAAQVKGMADAGQPLVVTLKYDVKVVKGSYEDKTGKTKVNLVFERV